MYRRVEGLKTPKGTLSMMSGLCSSDVCAKVHHAPWEQEPCRKCFWQRRVLYFSKASGHLQAIAGARLLKLRRHLPSTTVCFWTSFETAQLLCAVGIPALEEGCVQDLGMQMGLKRGAQCGRASVPISSVFAAAWRTSSRHKQTFAPTRMND